MPTRPAIESSFGKIAIAMIPPTAAILAVDLTVSTAELGLNMFFRPVSGLSFLKSGFSAFVAGLKPTWPTLATTPAIAQTNTIGAAPMIAWRARGHEEVGDAVRADDVRPLDEREDADRGLLHAPEHAGAEAGEGDQGGGQHDGAVDVRRLGDLALLARFLDLLWCCLLCLVVGHLAGHLQRVEGGGDRALQLVVDPAGDERHRGADQHEADGHLGREADREDVELRDDAREQAERRCR